MIGRLLTIWRVYRVVNNWVKALMVRLGILKSVPVKFKSGFEMNVARSNWSEFTEYVNFFYFLNQASMNNNKAEFLYEDNILKFELGKFGHQIITEIFGRDPYKKFLSRENIRNRIVIDIGASIGDTAVYFAINGAKRVIAFEPYPYSFKLAQKNIELNNLKNKCEIVNAGVGERIASIIISENYANIFGDSIKDFSRGTTIPIKSLDSIVNRADLGEGAVLKIDCEGCEYGVIDGASDKTLKLFKLIVIEYHNGPQNIPQKLKNLGFKVRIYFTSITNGREIGYLVAKSDI